MRSVCLRGAGLKEMREVVSAIPHGDHDSEVVVSVNGRAVLHGEVKAVFFVEDGLEIVLRPEKAESATHPSLEFFKEKL